MSVIRPIADKRILLQRQGSILFSEAWVTDYLKRWLESEEKRLVENGINTSAISGHSFGAFSLNLDSKKFVGTITFWPKNKYEFQFNDCDTGQVILLESKSFDDFESLDDYLSELLDKRLSNEA